jgi:uncharacterized membrane protein YcaP (DUF421 family)
LKYRLELDICAGTPFFGDHRARICDVSALTILLRIVLKRQTGTLGMTDLLLITLLIADASQNAMAGEYRSLPDGIVLVATIIFWNYFFELADCQI